MNHKGMKRGTALAITGALALGVAFTATPAQAAVTTITWQADGSPSSLPNYAAEIKAFQKLNPTIKVRLVSRPSGSDGDNLVKTKLATGTMEDVFTYNSGALLQALNPAKTLVDLTKETFQKNVYPSFQASVKIGKSIYGGPYSTAMGGGLYYNLADFAKVGVTPATMPKTWSDLIAVSLKLKAAGVDAFCGTFGDSWTDQMLTLADYYNVQLADPSFAKDYVANKAKFSYNPAAFRSFQKLEDVYKNGLWNADYATAKLSDGQSRVVSGQCAMYPMLTFSTSSIPDASAQAVGFMNVPGTDAKKSGLTLWMPNGAYIPKTTKHLAAAKKFVAFLASKAGTDAHVSAAGYTGPFMTKDQSSAPANVPLATKQFLALVKSGNTSPALEYLTPIKGPNMPSILAQIGSGQVSAKVGAGLYDQDVVAAAQQLGLAGW